VVVVVVLLASFLPLQTTTHMLLQKVHALNVPIINICPRHHSI
jgi:hypothetical protein